jgi:adenine-specific DNA-methyltransferase
MTMSTDRPTKKKPKRPIPGAPAKDTPGIKNPYVRFRPLEKPRVALHDTTLWDYPSQHYGKAQQGDQNYRGATPSHIIWNVLSRYTKKGDLVVDPFVGSGTTLDVCKDLERRSKGFDLQTSRPDVTIADARSALVEHVDRETAHLVFMDPPYADNLAYSDDARCIGKLAFEDGSWSEAMGRVVDGAMQALKAGGHLCCFVSDIMHVQQVKEVVAGRTHERVERRFGALGVDFARIALERGFIFVDHVAVVRRGKALDDPRLKSRAEQQAFMLRGFSHLLIFQKPIKAATTKPKWGRSPMAAAAAAPWTPRSAGTTSSASKLPPKPRAARGERGSERSGERTSERPAGGRKPGRKPGGGRRPTR